MNLCCCGNVRSNKHSYRKHHISSNMNYVYISRKTGCSTRDNSKCSWRFGKLTCRELQAPGNVCEVSAFCGPLFVAFLKFFSKKFFFSDSWVNLISVTLCWQWDSVKNTRKHWKCSIRGRKRRSVMSCHSWHWIYLITMIWSGDLKFRQDDCCYCCFFSCYCHCFWICWCSILPPSPQDFNSSSVAVCDLCHLVFHISPPSALDT